MPGWHQVLQYRGISPKYKVTNKRKGEKITNKQRVKRKSKKKILTTVIPLSNRGVMARASSAEVLGRHDDIVLVLLVLTHSG
jgi:hypothetical protein